MDERLLTERLVGYDTSRSEGLRAAAGFVKGWLESHDVAVEERDHGGLPVLLAEVGPADGPVVILHGHLDVVPAEPHQFEPVRDGDRIVGRGAYDMKGGLAGMLCALRDCAEQDAVRLRLVCVPDEESERTDDRAIDALLADGLTGDFAITGEPTDLRVGVQAKGVLALRAAVTGQSAHGSTPWLGENAILAAVDAYRAIQALPFAAESSDLYDRPSINLSRIEGGDVFNRVPDRCEITVDIRYLPGQDPEAILDAVRALPGVEVLRHLHQGPAVVPYDDPFVVVLRAAAAGVGGRGDGTGDAVGRHGASDAFAFLRAGIPAVEFGPTGAGHHGPDEWVSGASISAYRRALVDFVGFLGRRPRAEAAAPALGAPRVPAPPAPAASTPAVEVRG